MILHFIKELFVDFACGQQCIVVGWYVNDPNRICCLPGLNSSFELARCKTVRIFLKTVITSVVLVDVYVVF